MYSAFRVFLQGKYGGWRLFRWIFSIDFGTGLGLRNGLFYIAIGKTIHQSLKYDLWRKSNINNKRNIWRRIKHYIHFFVFYCSLKCVNSVDQIIYAQASRHVASNFWEFNGTSKSKNILFSPLGEAASTSHARSIFPALNIIRGTAYIVHSCPNNGQSTSRNSCWKITTMSCQSSHDKK